MVRCKSGYDPQEDSILLERQVRLHSFGKVLDMGTGSGIQAIAATQNSRVISVLATDVQKGVINYCKKCIQNPKIKFVQSDLFEKVKGKFGTIENAWHASELRSKRTRSQVGHFRKSQKPMVFDTIIFNPPYLPQELKLRDLTIEGGKKGYEVIERFLNEVNYYLNPNGIILMVFSSLTKKEKVGEFIKNNLLEFQELEKVHIFFEDIYVYMLKKSDLLKKLESRGINNPRYFTKGKRGLLFTGIYKNKKVVAKAKNPKSTAFGRIENEAKWLKKLNKYGIGPKLIIAEDSFFACEYVDGDFIIDYSKKSSKNHIKKIIKQIFNQMLVLDKLKIDKEEMHHPVKHVIISKNKPYIIDFERAHYSPSPKNVTQFCQFLISGYISNILKNKKIHINKNKMMQLAKIYKNNPSNANFKNIVGLI